MSAIPRSDVEESCSTFINVLNTRLESQLNGRRFDLPSEAEWEYAARGGRFSFQHKYSGSDNIDDVAWYDDDFGCHLVAQKQPNELGIYDMSGNVWEWCSDWYKSDYYSSSTPNNPHGPYYSSWRVIRGGGARSDARCCRVSKRDSHIPDGCRECTGLRLVIR